MDDKKIISIFGTSRAQAGDEIFSFAFETGQLLAEAGFTIANGGYGGTMLASAKGAVQAGGKTIGVTCSTFGSAKANEYIKREIITDSLDERLRKLIELGDGYVVLPGGTGTLLELAMVWELKNKGFLNQHKPIILLGRFWQQLVELIATDDSKSSGFVTIVTTPEQASEFLVNALPKQVKR